MRSDEDIFNKFDDALVVIIVTGNKTGRFALILSLQIQARSGRKPMNSKGCAILVPDQYRGVYKIDTHAGKYTALCQRRGNVKVFRDADKDHEHDRDHGTIDEGMFE